METGQRPRPSLDDLDAVTLDAYGTLVRLRDPIHSLRKALAEHGVERDEPALRAGFEAELAYYKAHRLEARDASGIAALHRGSSAVFLDALSVDLPEFDYAGALEYELLPGVEAALETLRGRGLRLAVAANWDASLPERLRELGLARYFSAVVTAADVQAEKPDPAVFRAALAALGVAPERALHIGDQPVDEQGALAAGMWFEPAPIGEAIARWT